MIGCYNYDSQIFVSNIYCFVLAEYRCFCNDDDDSFYYIWAILIMMLLLICPLCNSGTLLHRNSTRNWNLQVIYFIFRYCCVLGCCITVHRCGSLLHTRTACRVVCVSVGLCVGCTGELYKSDWIDCCAIWGQTHVGQGTLYWVGVKIPQWEGALLREDMCRPIVKYRDCTKVDVQQLVG